LLNLDVPLEVKTVEFNSIALPQDGKIDDFRRGNPSIFYHHSAPSLSRHVVNTYCRGLKACAARTPD
jgi:hypothetical protein